MTSTSRELLRQCLLMQLGQGAPYAVPAATLKVYAAAAGFPKLTDQELEAELQYLREKELAAIEQKIISPENKRWKITAKGRDALAEAGLA